MTVSLGARPALLVGLCAHPICFHIIIIIIVVVVVVFLVVVVVMMKMAIITTSHRRCRHHVLCLSVMGSSPWLHATCQHDSGGEPPDGGRRWSAGKQPQATLSSCCLETQVTKCGNQRDMMMMAVVSPCLYSMLVG